mmetsp:Transcript_27191/g.29285  ORF Transcript_27191/g.29285 Transcript_27191/m.29285 type:complete len:1339 (+) Transcript_27191:61-4077(+)
MFDINKYVPLLNHTDIRRFKYLLSRTAAIVIFCTGILVVRGVSSFPLFLDQRYRAKGRSILSPHKSTLRDEPSETSIEETVNLGRSELGKYFQFPLDDWQLQAGGYILNGHNVIVCAPTGSGKTVVGEMALHAAFDRNLEGVYTTPLKALSNQKFSDFRQIFGRKNVGLSTGDVSINREKARLTIMTTEVYRNIAWRSSAQSSDIDFLNNTVEEELVFDNKNNNDLRKNAVVVLDEFHYMGQPGRGGVWEECVITSPAHTQIVGLSATLPNALQLADWMESVTGRSTKLIEAPGARPAPLKYLFATREGLFPLFRNADAGPGSSLGLLGYRGDGVPSEKGNPKQKRKNGFLDVDDSNYSGVDKVPKGLQVNPALNSLAQRRVQKVNKMLVRQKSKNDNFDRSDWYQGGGRERGRGRLQMSSRETRRERERLTRREMRKAVPSLTILLSRLNEKNLLPAIFFIFSRKGCDEAAQTICNSFKGPRDPNIDLDLDNDFQKSYQNNNERNRNNREKRKRMRASSNKKSESNNILEDDYGRSFRLSSNNVDENIFNSVLDANQIFTEKEDFIFGSPVSSENWKLYSSAGFLDYDEVREVAGRVVQFNEVNPEIAFTDDVIEQLLFGIGCHHAGMLPAHKMLVESLFRANLMKAVFATETLSAGINMPARTTVICSLAKRGDNGMAQLETSNLLQMAGRAGRRGFDSLGTCVLVATPFEGEDVAATILTNPVKPITSQFRPSYSLAMNLIVRGKGNLSVAKQLVSKSFANWGRQEMEKARSISSDNNNVDDVLIHVSEEKFMHSLIRVFDQTIQNRSAQFDVALLNYLLKILKDRELLKKSSKDFDAATLALDLETITLSCLEIELESSNGSGTKEVLDEVNFKEEEEDDDEFLEQVNEQRNRVNAAEKKLKKHPFALIVNFSNKMLGSECSNGKELLDVLQSIQGMGDKSSVDAEDIARFAKSSIMVKNKLKKLARSNPNIDKLFSDTQKSTIEIEDSAWKDMLAITKVLIAYGCIAPKSGAKEEYSDIDLENEIFIITPAGNDVGMLSFGNSLFFLLAMGGTFDVTNVSAKFDELKQAMQIFDDDDMDVFADHNDDIAKDNEFDTVVPSKARQEAETLIYHLQELTPGEMAGYVSCLVAGDTGRRNGVSSIDIFKRLGPRLQRSIQMLLDGTERFVDVQRQFFVDERTCNCQFDLSHCEVITAWANGCTWSEALEISGAAPGDLTRIIGRATDAVRQLGALKFSPVRKKDLQGKSSALGIVDPFSRGLHPEVRHLCHEAAKKMNRYPVKDPLPFEMASDDILTDLEDDNDNEMKVAKENKDETNDVVDTNLLKYNQSIGSNS